MSPFQQFIFYGFVPIFSFFLLERFFFTYYFRKTERRKNFIRNTKFLHPNNISKFRYPMGFLCVAIYHYLSPELALFLWGASMISDLTDGTIARHYQMSTPQGASIDPLSDKLMLLPPLFYLVYLESVNIWLVSVFIVLDFGGQYLRRFKKIETSPLLLVIDILGNYRAIVPIKSLIILAIEAPEKERLKLIILVPRKER